MSTNQNDSISTEAAEISSWSFSVLPNQINLLLRRFLLLLLIPFSGNLN